MKKKISFLLSLAVVLACFSPLTAFAINETAGSTDVNLEIPQRTDTGSGTGGEDPAYSYLVNIPASYTITSKSNTFQITASEMNIPTDKRLVVRVNGAETFENDGSFYLFLNGDKSSENWVLCNLYRIQRDVTGAVTGQHPILASFGAGELTPSSWGNVRMEYVLYNGGANLAPDTYTGTIHYTVAIMPPLGWGGIIHAPAYIFCKYSKSAAP